MRTVKLQPYKLCQRKRFFFISGMDNPLRIQRQYLFYRRTFSNPGYAYNGKAGGCRFHSRYHAVTAFIFHNRKTVSHAPGILRCKRVSAQIPLPDTPGNSLLNINVLLQRLEIPEQPMYAVKPVLYIQLPFTIIISYFIREHPYHLFCRPDIRQCLNQGVPLVFRNDLAPVFCFHCIRHHL